jgi:hypothetical protein
MAEDFHNELTAKIARFLNEIGIQTVSARLISETFLPGVLVAGGKLLVDEERLAFPGDLLHEAGHLAVAPAELRDKLNDEVIVPGVNLGVLESQAILWSYAASVHLGIDPRIVFHEGGYRGKSENLLFSFSLGVYAGLNGLEAAGMAFSESRARELGIEPFPIMQKWLRD